MGVLLLNPAADDVIVGDDDFDDETVTSVEVMMNVGMAKFNFGRKEHAGTCVEVPGISSVWPSHQRVTLWCNGLRACLVRRGPEFCSHQGRVVKDGAPTCSDWRTA